MIALVNIPIKNLKCLSVLVLIVLGIKNTPLTYKQVIKSNLICDINLVFVCTIGPYEYDIMEHVRFLSQYWYKDRKIISFGQ